MAENVEKGCYYKVYFLKEILCSYLANLGFRRDLEKKRKGTLQWLAVTPALQTGVFTSKIMLRNLKTYHLLMTSPCTTSSWRWSMGRPNLAISFSGGRYVLSSVNEYVRFPACTCRSCSKSLRAAVKSQFLPTVREKDSNISLSHRRVQRDNRTNVT